MRITILTALLVCAAGPVFGDLKSNGNIVNTIDLYADAGYTGFGGDTYHFTAWTGPSSGGNFGGGRIYGSYNDGHGCTGGGNIAFLEMTRLDWTTKSNTAMTCINSMTSYGSHANEPAGWTEAGVAWKSYDPFSYNGDIYWFVNRQEISNPWRASMSTILTSPDRGLHWCNPATFASGGKCDSSNYKADGDAPPNPSTGMMWGSVGVYTSPMARPMHVQFCQDENCTGMPFNADNYLYFVSNTGLVDRLYASCVAKSKAAIMDVTQWWYWTGGNGNCGDTNSWTHTIANAAPIQSQGTQGGNDFGYPSAIIYIPQAGQFLMTSYDFDNRTVLLSGNTPWGPWKRITTMATGGQGGFSATNLAWLDSTCSGCNTNPGRWRLTFAASVYGHTSDASLYLYQVDIANGGPNTAFGGVAGMGNLGRLPVRASNGGTGGRYILNGLTMAYAYDDKLDYPNAALPSAGLYFRDMLGSTRCLVSGMNPPGYMVWGLQSTTPPISYAANGIYLGGQYAAQLSSNDANCSGVLPLSGDAAFTVQMVIKMDNVSPSSGAVLFDLFDPSLSGANRAHADFYAALNAGWEGGSHLDIGEYNGSQYFQASPSWANGQYVVITVVKRPGVLNAANASVYVGKTSYPLTALGTPANGLGMNLSSNLKLRMGCWGFGNPTYCNPGQSGETQNAAVHSFFALYNRALSADEVAHNYAALKAAMARSPRAIILQ